MSPSPSARASCSPKSASSCRECIHRRDIDERGGSDSIRCLMSLRRGSAGWHCVFCDLCVLCGKCPLRDAHAAADPGRRRYARQCRDPAAAPRKPGLRGRSLAGDGEEALATIRELLPDLVLLDIMMPKLDGIERSRQLKADTAPAVHPGHPGHREGRREGRRRRARSRRRRLPDKAGRPRGAARAGARDAAHQGAARHGAGAGAPPRGPGGRAGAVEPGARNPGRRRRSARSSACGRLKRFLPPQLAELIVARGDERILESHRREIVVVFCDLRGFTAFAETAEPEEVRRRAARISRRARAAGHRVRGHARPFLGDGIMVFFNDPLPCPDPAERAVAMAVDDARGGRRVCRPSGGGAGTRSASASASRRATRRWARSVSPSGSTTRRSGRSATSPRGSAPPPTTARSSSAKRVAGRGRRTTPARRDRRPRPEGAQPGGRGVQHRRGAGIAAAGAS